MSWDPTNWQPGNWQPPNWQPPATVPLPVDTVYTISAFLDRFGRFAKREEDIAYVRLWPEDAIANAYLEYTVSEFNALSSARRLEIQNLDSAAGLVPTDGISNA